MVQRRSYILRGLATLALAVVLGAAVPSGSPESARLSVLLDGRTVPTTEAGMHYCHDLAYPVIRCFDTADAAEADESRIMQSTDGVTVVSYVRMYEHRDYGGVWVDLAYDYQDLNLIGWNDRTSSFKGLNCQLGSFFEHTNWGGGRYDFGCNQLVSYVGDAWNDKFSSSRRR